MVKIVIFGASGDLARRKLFPALSSMDSKSLEVIGYSRTMMDGGFVSRLEKVKEYKKDFLERIRYISGEYDELHNLQVPDTSIFYLSTPPHLYLAILNQLAGKKTPRIALEKPFGSSPCEFMKIKEVLKSSDANVYLVDHYLYKPMSIAIPTIFSKSESFRSFFQSKNIKSVEVIFKESIGGEGRLYFDENGIVSDIVQNHLAEIVATVCSRGEIERSGFLKSACEIDVSKCMFGQYDKYQKELGKTSATATFCVIPLYFEDKSWSGVPFVIIAGKGLDEKRCELVFEVSSGAFGDLERIIRSRGAMKAEEYLSIEKAWVFVNYSPRNEIFVKIQAPEKHIEYVLYSQDDVNAIMSSKYGCYTDHEIVFDSLIKGKPFPCVTVEEADILWRIFNPSLFEKQSLSFYEKGSNHIYQVKELIENIKRS